MNPLFANLPNTIFDVMSGLARAHGAINLGQGFPDAPGPAFVRQAAADASLDGYNQYPPMAGIPELRQAVAGHYARRQNLSFDWQSEIAVTSGATEALAASFLALLSPGDEAILFQPLYDSYAPMVRLAGAKPVLARLAPPAFRWDRAMIEALITPRTKLIALNNPLNPAGVVYSREDLALLAEICVERDLLAICDEVWEEVVFAPARHHPLIGFAGMRERAVKIGSAGKMFGLTGWKVGFVCAAEPLLRVIVKVHQFLTFTTPPNLQAAVAKGLNDPGDWFETMTADLARSRGRLAAALTAERFAVLPGAGTYFLNIDLAASGVTEADRDFAFRAVQEHGVASIPVSAFYEEDPVTHILRLSFAKSDAVLDEGAARLAAARAAGPLRR